MYEKKLNIMGELKGNAIRNINDSLGYTFIAGILFPTTMAGMSVAMEYDNSFLYSIPALTFTGFVVYLWKSYHSEQKIRQNIESLTQNQLERIVAMEDKQTE